MKKIKIQSIIIATIAIASVSCQREMTMAELTDTQLKRCAEQYALMAESLIDSHDRLPQSANPDGTLKTTGPHDWVSGFVPGSLWYLYEYSQDPKFKDWAKNYTERLDDVKNYRGTHDLGFMLFCSYGNGLRLTGDTAYRSVLLTGSNSLITRFRPSVGCIRSWDNKKWEFPVIIDNMMNLEMLFWASEASGDPKYKNICTSHADTTVKNHFRPDFSSYHVVSYDTITGKVISRGTHQGFADESAWARGQAWGLYGYTMAYRCTKDPKYLEQAKNIAGFIIDHPNLPENRIPYWDFNSPDIPNTYRDASAGAIICSALIELSGYVDAELAKKYREVAEKQIRTLSSPEYFAETGTNANFILKHSVGHLPGNSQIDVPLTYADYYYIEALMRMKKSLTK